VTDLPSGSLPVPVVPGLTDLSLLARGGYATIYRAVQEFVGREVAVKVENRTLVSERDRQRFLREARAAARMSSHPHVVDLFDAGITAGGNPYLIMELCDGSYADVMRTTRLGAAETRDLGVKIADALADAHELGVLHRDVKPANILRTRFGEPALADFGLAVIAEVRDPSVTLEVLTPAYAAPEMFRHSPPSPAVDVYALCATLYAVMNGRPPRWDQDTNPSLVTLLEMFDQPIPDLPGVPPALTEVLRLGMANDPAARPSARQLRDLLAALPLGPAPAPATAPPATQPAAQPTVYLSHSAYPPQPSPAPRPAPPASHPPAPHPVGGPERSFRPMPWLIGTVGVLTLLLAIAGFWFFVNRPGSALQGGGGSTPTPAISPSAQGTATQGAAGILPLGGGILPGCLVPLPGGGRCPTELECFGPIEQTDSGVRAQPVSCDERHTWEVYAIGDLPAAVDVTDPALIEQDPAVREVCSAYSFRLVTLGRSVSGWQFRVLPPEPRALANGDRTYRCLAGRGPGGLTGPTLTG
jgi:eukaryotic-like serine/threonine-protein kinase